MEQILPANWVYIHFGLIFAITCAQMLVLYMLAESSKPPAGLGLFTVYFMASLLGWIALTLQQNSGVHMAIDVPSVMAILNSYILFMAVGQRAGVMRGRLILGIACLGACLSVFFLPPQQMFLVEAAALALFFAAAGLISGWRCIAFANIGDAIISCAAVVMIVGMPAAIYAFLSGSQQPSGPTIAFGIHSASYALVAIGFLASVLIEYQQHLSHLTTQDPLTRLLNRRGMEDALHISMANAQRRSLPTSAVMIDIDHFKQVNESFGQEVGDHVIRQVADIISRLCRSSDVIARTGGEEFLLVLPETEMDSARVLAERIREAIGDRPLLVDFQRIPVTVSLGVASVTGEVDLDALALEADRAMYLAKRSGRNRVASVEHRPVRMTTARHRGDGD